MAHKFGFASVNSNFNRNREDNSKIQEQLTTLSERMIAGRVIDIILDRDHPRFDEFNGFAGLGTIIVDRVENTPSNVSNNSPVLLSATPLLPNIKNYPTTNLYEIMNKKVPIKDIENKLKKLFKMQLTKLYKYK